MIRLAGSGARSARRQGVPRGIRADVDEWLDDMRIRLSRGPEQVRRGKRVAEALIAFGNIAWSNELRPLLVMRWLRERAKSVGRKTLINDASSLRGFGDYLVAVERIPTNPLLAIKAPRPPRAFPYAPFTCDEMRRIIAVAREAEESGDGRTARYGPLRSTFYAFLAHTGLRYSEARRARWAEIDLVAKTMRVRGKYDRADVLPLTEEIVGALKEWRVHSLGRKVFRRTPSHHSLQSDMRRAKVERSRGDWHRWRKSAITERARNGAQLRELHAFARHVDPKTTSLHYDFVRLEEVRRAAGLIPNLGRFPFESVDKTGPPADSPPRHHENRANTRISEIRSRCSAKISDANRARPLGNGTNFSRLAADSLERDRAGGSLPPAPFSKRSLN